MPFYEYECEACDCRKEIFHGMNERPDVKCDICNGPVRKVIFPASVIFKGGGFYATEYGKSTHNNPKKSSSSSTTTTSPAAKTESGSAPKEASPKSETPTPAASSPASSASETKKAA